MNLDECIADVRTLIRGFNDSAMDVINLKINRVGGLTKTRYFRDLCVSMEITMKIQRTLFQPLAT
jgi:L-alanine-DL-glutamate epimerase-like enolase superfamily enzyme